MLVAATNEHFFEQYPAGPQHLDPNDPGQQLYVMEWVRIRDQILGDGVTSLISDSSANTSEEPAQATTAEPSADQFDQEASRVRDYLKGTLELNQLPTDAPPVKFIEEQLDVARSLYLGRHFDRHDEWTSTTRDFDIGVGFNNLGVQVRVVGADRAVRMGLVGDGRPTSVAGRTTPAPDAIVSSADDCSELRRRARPAAAVSRRGPRSGVAPHWMTWT